MEEFFKINPNFFNNNNTNIFNNNMNKNKNLYQKQISHNYYQNNTPTFMVAKFGKKKVISQDLNTFLNSIKHAEWTNNPAYLAAKDIEVKPSFKINNLGDNTANIPNYSNTIDKLYLHLNKININDFINYTKDINERQNKIDFYVKKEKEIFITNNFGFNEGKLDMNSILESIKNNSMNFIAKDQILYNKINQALN